MAIFELKSRCRKYLGLKLRYAYYARYAGLSYLNVPPARNAACSRGAQPERWRCFQFNPLHVQMFRFA
jgi:hypothetical protein